MKDLEKTDMHAHTTSSQLFNDCAQSRISRQTIRGHNNDSQPLSHDEEEADDQDLKSVAITFLSLGGLVLILLTVVIWLILR